MRGSLGDHGGFPGYRPGRALVRVFEGPGFPAATAAICRTSASSSEPVTTEAGCYPEPLRPAVWVPRLSGASPVSSSSAAWRTSPATASRSCAGVTRPRVDVDPDQAGEAAALSSSVGLTCQVTGRRSGWLAGLGRRTGP
jgi:hypothetical protein